jgi:hypothetical protein
VNKALAAHLKERCELLEEQMNHFKQTGKTESADYSRLQQCYIENSQAYNNLLGDEIKKKMDELGVKRTPPTPKTVQELRDLGLSEQAINVLKGLPNVVKRD